MSYNEDTDRVMVDIETLGTEPGAVVMSIGACRFDPVTGVRDTFYTKIDVGSCVEHGLKVDPDTEAWWESQEQETPDDGDTPLPYAVADFSEWLEPGPDELWANSPAFDCKILEAAYEAVDRTEPWEFYQLRDVRTLRKLPGTVSIEMDGDAHDALDDARNQAREASHTLHALNTAMNGGEQR